METPEYAIMCRAEERHWWYRALHHLVLGFVQDRIRSAGGGVRLLDAGCGTGKLLELCGTGQAVGLERSTEAFRWLGDRRLSGLVRGSVDRLPFPDDSFDLVVSNDVICCVRSPGDLDSVREFGRVLRPGGWLILNLPAYESLRSHHDAAVHTQQRYTRRRLVELLDLAGLRSLRLSYRNSFLLPIAATVRLVQRAISPSPERPGSDLKHLPEVLNWLLLQPLLLENWLIRAGVRLPVGLSVFCVAIKPEPESESAGPKPAVVDTNETRRWAETAGEAR